jgi:threonyl-tRNA synthetase
MKISSIMLSSILLSTTRVAMAFTPTVSKRIAGAAVSTAISSSASFFTRFSAPRSSTATTRFMATQAPEKEGTKTADDIFDELPTNENDGELLRIRHSSGHVMAMAVQKLFPEAQVTIGPWIDNGFYYDFYFPETIDAETGETIESRKLTTDDLKKVKKQMDKIISKNYPITREEVTREEAERRIKEINEPFKLEILEGLVEPITIYHIGDEWWDLCAGPHVESTNQIPKKAIALQSVAGAYWRGDENREMLQRIYATGWKDPMQLKQYKKMLEEAKKRDHRMLGKKLDLFSIQEGAGGGLVFWHPKGSKVRKIIEDYWKDEHAKDDYDVIYTPHIANLDLWKTSGHFDFYKEDMFDQMEVENEQYQIKPMNCPFHCLMYKNELRSYRDLPIRWAELGTVYRYVHFFCHFCTKARKILFVMRLKKCHVCVHCITIVYLTFPLSSHIYLFCSNSLSHALSLSLSHTHTHLKIRTFRYSSWSLSSSWLHSR